MIHLSHRWPPRRCTAARSRRLQRAAPPRRGAPPPSPHPTHARPQTYRPQVIKKVREHHKKKRKELKKAGKKAQKEKDPGIPSQVGLAL